MILKQKLKRGILITLTTVFLLSFFVGCIPSAQAAPSTNTGSYNPEQITEARKKIDAYNVATAKYLSGVVAQTYRGLMITAANNAAVGWPGERCGAWYTAGAGDVCFHLTKDNADILSTQYPKLYKLITTNVLDFKMYIGISDSPNGSPTQTKKANDPNGLSDANVHKETNGDLTIKVDDNTQATGFVRNILEQHIASFLTVDESNASLIGTSRFVGKEGLVQTCLASHGPMPIDTESKAKQVMDCINSGVNTFWEKAKQAWTYLDSEMASKMGFLQDKGNYSLGDYLYPYFIAKEYGGSARTFAPTNYPDLGKWDTKQKYLNDMLAGLASYKFENAEESVRIILTDKLITDAKALDQNTVSIAQISDANDGDAAPLRSQEDVFADPAVTAAQSGVAATLGNNLNSSAGQVAISNEETWVCQPQDMLTAPFTFDGVFDKANYPTGMVTGLICRMINGGILGLANMFQKWVGINELKDVLDIYNVTAPNSLAVRIWQMLRDIINSMFVLAFLIMAAVNVVGPLIKIKMYDDWRVGKKIPEIVGAIFLVNFSLSIANLIILFANALTNLFLNNVTGLQKMGAAEIGGVGILYALITALVVLAVSALSVYYYLVLWVRVIIINLLVMFAAAPYVGGILPVKRISGTTERWFGEFTRWVFMGPSLAFILYIVYELTLTINAFSAGLANPVEKLKGIDASPVSLYQEYDKKPIFASLSTDLSTFFINNKDNGK